MEARSLYAVMWYPSILRLKIGSKIHIIKTCQIIIINGYFLKSRLTAALRPKEHDCIDRRYGKMGFLKKLTMAKPEKVVRKALKDCKGGKSVSVYGMPMKLLYKLTRGLIQ